jgi:hypothetical protein
VWPGEEPQDGERLTLREHFQGEKEEVQILPADFTEEILAGTREGGPVQLPLLTVRMTRNEVSSSS